VGICREVAAFIPLFLASTHPILAKRLKGVLYHAMHLFFLTPCRLDGILHHPMILQVLLPHPLELLHGNMLPLRIRSSELDYAAYRTTQC
jgi:hypothetical protein